MRLSKPQIECLGRIKDHLHPHNNAAFRNNTLLVNDDLRTTAMRAYKVAEKTLLTLERAGLVQFMRYSWYETFSEYKGKRKRTARLLAEVRITPAGVDLFIQQASHK
jgi:hypothetical protein